jgi:CheY-like chemotaxis protein
MPKVQGFEVLRRLKEDPATADVPVIVLSNLGQETDVQRALQGGARGYLIKANLSLDELVQGRRGGIAGMTATGGPREGVVARFELFEVDDQTTLEEVFRVAV